MRVGSLVNSSSIDLDSEREVVTGQEGRIDIDQVDLPSEFLSEGGQDVLLVAPDETVAPGNFRHAPPRTRSADVPVLILLTVSTVWNGNVIFSGATRLPSASYFPFQIPVPAQAAFGVAVRDRHAADRMGSRGRER